MTVKDDGDRNFAAAISGDLSLAGATKDQITAMGGEVDDELDDFKPSTVDRGDSVDPPKPTDDKADDKSEDDKDEDKSDDKADDKSEDDKDEDKPADKADDKSEDDKDEDKSDDKADDKKDPPKKDPDQRIPKSRFDEVNARRKAAEDELAQLKAQSKAKDDASKNRFDFDKAEEEYMALLLDGKTKDALSKRKEINTAQEAVWDAKQEQRAGSTVDQRAVQAELNVLVKKYEGEFDAFDPEHEGFSEDIADEVQSMFVGYLQNRKDLTAGEAFTLAVDNAVKIYALPKRGAEPPAKGDEDKADDPKPNVRVKDKKDTKKKIEAAKAAPKNPDKAGESGDKGGAAQLDIENMTDEEFNALPESTKARMRGDLM